MNKVFIHIGLPKTATSSIQSFLYENSAFLHQHGYHYFQTGLNHNLKCHHDLIWKLGLHKGPSYIEEDIQKYKQEILDGIKAEVANNPDKDFILSSELLTFIGDFNKLKPVLDIFQGREIKYILNLRRQDRFIESLYQQVVKDGIAQSFQEWFDKARSVGNYNVLITKLLKISSKEHVMIDIFDSRISNLHPTENFLLALGFDKAYLSGFNIENVRENESLSKDQIDRLKASNMLNPNLRFALIQEFTEMNSHGNFEKAQFLNDEERKRIIDSFQISNLKLIENVGIRPEIAKYLLG